MKPLLLGVALAFIALACAPLRHPQATASPAALFPELDTGMARTAFQQGWRFLDARSRDAFLEGHIPGALLVPIQARDGEDRLMDFLTGPEGDPARPVVVYGGGCCNTEDLYLAQRLKDAGSQRPHVFRDGLPAWSRACHPTTTEVP